MRNQGSSKQKWVERQSEQARDDSAQIFPPESSLPLLTSSPASVSSERIREPEHNDEMWVLCQLCNQKSLCNQMWGQWLCHLNSLLLRKCITDMGKERSHPFMSAPGWSCLLTALGSFSPLPPRWTFSASLALISKWHSCQ